MKRLVVNQYQLFCINVVLLVLADWMQSSRLFQNIPFVVVVFKYSALLFGILAFILEYKKGLNIKETAKLYFLILLSLLTCLKTRNMSYLLIVLIITIAKGVHVDDFIKVNFKVSVVCAIIQISLWILNCFVNLGFPIYENAIERRIGFLYNHPNMAAVKLGWMIIMWLWLRWDIIQKKDYAIAAIATGLLYYTTRSDGCILIYVFILLMILKSKPIIIDSRYRSRKPLIVTTNLTLTELKNPQDTAHARIYDRLLELCTPIACTGPSMRKNIGQAKLNLLKTLLA